MPESTKSQTMVVGADKMDSKLAMSRALGAAFLSHQVEQLERAASSPAGAWRRDAGRGGAAPRGVGVNVRQRTPSAGVGAGGSPPKTLLRRREPSDSVPAAQGDARPKRRSNEGSGRGKDADVVIVDASVLVHCIGQVKAWCRDGREETIVVPLEALNTLDLLKKGTTLLAQRARGASRLLEGQVGTNPRIRVQSDTAFVPWGDIAFTAAAEADKDKAADGGVSPEWVRRTVCCARWEANKADDGSDAGPPRKIVLAVAQDAPALIARAASDAASPVPLPAPHPVGASKFEPRAAGALVRSWAARAGIQLLEIKPTPMHDEAPGGGGGGGERNVHPPSAGPNKSPGRSRRPEHGPYSSGPRNTGGGGGGGGNGNGGGFNTGSLVERPPAVKAVMAMVAKPSGGIRLLARGEKLEP